MAMGAEPDEGRSGGIGFAQVTPRHITAPPPMDRRLCGVHPRAYRRMDAAAPIKSRPRASEVEPLACSMRAVTEPSAFFS